MESHKACFLGKHVFTGLVWLSTQRRSFGLKATLSQLEGELTISSTSVKEQQERMGAVCSLSSSNASEQPVFFCRFFYSSQCLDFHLSFLPFLKVFKAFLFLFLLFFFYCGQSFFCFFVFPIIWLFSFICLFGLFHFCPLSPWLSHVTFFLDVFLCLLCYILFVCLSSTCSFSLSLSCYFSFYPSLSLSLLHSCTDRAKA